MTQLVIIACIILSTTVFAEPVDKKTTTIDPFQSVINQHYDKYAKMEHFSAIQVSIKSNGEIKTFVKGTKVLSDPKQKISKDDLFNIGSITKSFTGVLTVLAETENKLKLNDTLEKYLKTYPHWNDLTLEQLLNMSSGLPNYSDSPKINYLFSKNIKQYWSPVELIALVYSKEYNPPLEAGYNYTNSGYVLMDMILSGQYKMSFRQLLRNKIIDKYKLKNTFYPIPSYPTEILARRVHGYSYNVYTNPELLGQDVTDNNLSWGGAAGGLVSNSKDLIRWAELLFTSDDLINAEQKEKMQRLISVKTGQALKKVSPDDPQGFGLGVIQAYRPSMGTYWYYEGETLGYRALYVYVPCNDVIISALFNSATNSGNDHSGQLMEALYKKLLANNKELRCKKKT